MVFTDVLARHRRIAVIAAVLLLTFLYFLFRPPVAQAATDGETAFVLNTFAFLIWGVLVMWMAAGFTMLEAGAVRTKNASMICLKNVGLYSIAGLAYFFVGYNLMYVDVSGDRLWGLIGSFNLLYGPSSDELALLDGDQRRRGGGNRERLLGHVGLVLPDGLRSNHGIHHFRRPG